MKNDVKLNPPKYARDAVGMLNSNGFSAHLVGGCVRDLLLKHKPLDYDIATSAEPADVTVIFRKTYPTGLKHGTVTAFVKNHPLQITTYRKDGSYSDGRRPDAVSFTEDLREDLKRRDFTVNAMAWSEKDGLIDLFGGFNDLSNKIIRCVGKPEERFFEDPLRILRAFRFQATLGFDIESKTYAAARLLKDRIAVVSAERVNAELCRMILSKRIEPLLKLINEGFLIRFGVNKAPDSILLLNKACKHKQIRAAALAVFLERAGSIESAYELLKSLRFDKKTLSLAKSVHDVNMLPDEFSIKKIAAQYGVDAAFCASCVYYMQTGNGAVLKKLKSINKRGDCMSLSCLKISGEELYEIGITEGKEIGRILNKLLQHILIHPEDNKTDKLTYLAKNIIQKTAE